MQFTRRHWQWILGMMLLSLVLAACGGVRADEVSPSAPPSGPIQQYDRVPSEGTPVNVVATNFAFALDRSQADAGTVTFAVTNDSTMPHDFAIESQGVDRQTAMLQPGQSASLTVDLTPGTYTYVCTILGHAQLGMKGVFTVN